MSPTLARELSWSVRVRREADLAREPERPHAGPARGLPGTVRSGPPRRPDPSAPASQSAHRAVLRGGLLLATLALALPTPAAADDLLALRNDQAVRFFEAEPHLKLARRLMADGNRLSAFYLMENARRRLIEEEIFDAEFARVFRGVEPFDNSVAAEQALRAEITGDAPEPAKLLALADIHISRSEWAEAEKWLARAVEADPADPSPVAAWAEVRRRQGDEEGAQAIESRFRERNPDSLAVLGERARELAGSDPAAARTLLEAGLERHPDSGDLLFTLAAVLAELGDPGAPAMYERAARAAPESAFVQGWTGRYFLKVVDDPARALDYYLNAYFLDPHFYDSEYAESRVRTINWEIAGGIATELLARGTEGALAALRHDNPVVVEMAIKSLEGETAVAAFEDLLRLLSADDVTVRWNAMTVLRDQLGDRIEPVLDDLLAAPDLRARGLAAYLAVHRRAEASFPAIRELLASEAVLLRYDALSALSMHGGDAGRALIAERAPLEDHPRLVPMIEYLLQEPEEREE